MVLNYLLDFILKDIRFHFDITLLMGTKQCPPRFPFNRVKYNITLLVLIYVLNCIASKIRVLLISAETSVWIRLESYSSPF